ncbi:TnsA endonuclease N-terminal domain-containing protein [Bacillus cereus group sp. N21]|uniref:TnsA endonuclease N-terminal domain-containing protein n=1 Tax=Bacillus cereus group sp. N21 TaxID=2794591 RepID=UPI001F5B485A|nr:TnsA endonuclease N-terminal domain-containing protein [Bacillus cereus group sp. N21]
MSDLESDYFYLLEWSSTVTDIREQFPLLPIEETVSIAEGLGIKHPHDNRTQEIVVMTTDFIINIDSKEFVRTLKYAGDLEDAHTIEKFEIEREYWRRRNIDWGIVTDKEIPEIFCENVKWVRKEYHNPDVVELGPFIVESIEKIVYQLIQDETTPLSIATSHTDDRLGLEPGTSLAMIRHFIARKRWIVNMNEKIVPSLPLKGVWVFLPIPRKGGIRQNIPNYILSYSSSSECSCVNLVKISSSLMFSMIVSKFTTVGDLLNS